MERLLGAPLVASAESRRAAFALDGRAPDLAAFPETPEQVAELLALANAQGWGVVPWGGGHGMGAGGAPSRYQVALSLSRLEKLLDHDADNLTLTGEGGLALAEANRRMAPAHQFLPLGLPGDRGTLGGIVAAARPAPRRLLYGDVRDMLIGIRVALPDGSLVRYGRKVIKNVAGYDMNKLFLGSQGMLGVIVEATFKLFALPDEERHLPGTFPDAASAAQAAGALLASHLLPASLLLFDRAMAPAFCTAARLPPPAGQPLLLAGFEGRAAALRRQVEGARELMARHGGTPGEPVSGLEAAACDFLLAPAPEPTQGEGAAPPVRLRIGVTPREVAELLDDLRTSLAELGVNAAMLADCGAGSVRAVLPWPGDEAAAEPLAESLAEWIATLRRRLAPERGYALLQSAPAALKARVHVWGEMEGDMKGEGEIMALIKGRLDPKGILAPGRYLPDSPDGRA